MAHQSEINWDQLERNFAETLARFKAIQEGQLYDFQSKAFITKYNIMKDTLSQLYEQYESLQPNSGRFPWLTPDHLEIIITRTQQLQQLSNEVDAWANEQEAALYEMIEENYYPATEEPITINLGKLFFRQSKHDPQVVDAIKFSNTSGPTVEDPVQEAWFCLIGGKDKFAFMLHLKSATTLRQKFINVTKKQAALDLFKYITLHPEDAQARSIEIFSNLCYALDYMHNHLGIAHLDLKPENVFLSSGEAPVLADFGMARIGDFPIHPYNQTNTHNNNNVGKFPYAYHMTNIFRHSLAHLCIDEASSGIFPRFAAPFVDFMNARNHFLVGNNDILQFVSGLQIGCGGAMKPAAQLRVTDKGNPIVPPLHEEISPDSSLFFFSPHNPAPSFQILWFLLHHDGPILDANSLGFLLQHSQFCLSLTINDYDQLLGHQIAQQNGVPEDEMAAFAVAHTQTNPTPPGDFYNIMCDLLKNKLAFSDELLAEYLYFELAPNSPPAVYTKLNPDLSTLAQRPVTKTLGTRAYMAPELLNPGTNGKISYDPFKADIYSLGVIFFILVYGFPPYRDALTTDPAYSRLIVHSKVIPPGQTRAPLVTRLIQDYAKVGLVHESITNLLDRMICFDVKNRISLKRIINEFLPQLRLK